MSFIYHHGVDVKTCHYCPQPACMDSDYCQRCKIALERPVAASNVASYHNLRAVVITLFIVAMVGGAAFYLLTLIGYAVGH